MLEAGGSDGSNDGRDELRGIGNIRDSAESDLEDGSDKRSGGANDKLDGRSKELSNI